MSELHAALRSYRSSKAAALSQPAFCVFSNAELDALVAACPHSTIELERPQIGIHAFLDRVVRHKDPRNCDSPLSSRCDPV